MSEWKRRLLDQVEGEIRGKFSWAVEIEREKDTDGEMRLLVTWRYAGGGAYVRLPADLHVAEMTMEKAVNHVIDRLWQCAPIAGSC